MPRPAASPPTPLPAARKASAPQRALQRLGLVSDLDLALHLPLRYEDETRVVAIADVHDGEMAQVEGVVVDTRVELRPRRQLLVRLRDDSGGLLLRFLHFYPSQQKTLAAGVRLRARGELRRGFFGREIVHPAVRVVAPGAPLPQALTPVYPAGAQLPQAYLRKAIAAALARAPLKEVLPTAALPPGLPTLRDALRLLHQPPPQVAPAALQDHSHPAWQRLKFEELLAQQLSQQQARLERASLVAPALAARAAGLFDRLLATLPFRLTAAQTRAVAEIGADLAQPAPMHRLLQGDVGSGKTVVAALAAARAIDAGWQCALMAPTELLAEQHFRKLVSWLEPLGVATAWLTGSRRGKARTEALARVADGRAALVVGTQAVIQDDVVFQRLGLAIVDEQHRFGVAQRLALRRKLGDQRLEPHLLMMRPERQHDRRAAARPHTGADQGLRRGPARRGDRAHPRRDRRRPAGVLGVPAGRRRRRRGCRAGSRSRGGRRGSRQRRRAPAERGGGGRGVGAPARPRGSRGDGPARRDAHPRRTRRRAARPRGRPAARPAARGRKGGGDGRVRRRPAAAAGGHHRDPASTCRTRR